jgi:hypothetical protein
MKVLKIEEYTRTPQQEVEHKLVNAMFDLALEKHEDGMDRDDIDSFLSETLRNDYVDELMELASEGEDLIDTARSIQADALNRLDMEVDYE